LYLCWGASGTPPIVQLILLRAQRESNPCFRRERAQNRSKVVPICAKLCQVISMVIDFLCLHVHLWVTMRLGQNWDTRKVLIWRALPAFLEGVKIVGVQTVAGTKLGHNHFRPSFTETARGAYSALARGSQCHERFTQRTLKRDRDAFGSRSGESHTS
jgi:hypothetical protein